MASSGMAFGRGANAVVWQNVHVKLQPRVVKITPTGIGQPPGNRNSETSGGCCTAPTLVPSAFATASSLYPLKTSSKLLRIAGVSAP